jgi:choline dehydrogenase-like flavoprotein
MSEDVQFDVIVVGSGMSGGWAAKEFCQKGMKTLVLERGKDVEAGADYVGENKAPWDMEFRDRVDPKLVKSDYPVQSQCYAFRESDRNFFINDRENPYSVEDGTKFSWIRGDQVGGKSILWARHSYRWSDLDFGANAKDGYGTDWPIRYADVKPWYEYVEKFVGIAGSEEGLPQLPDSIFQPAIELNSVELDAKAKLESQYDDRKLIIGRVAHLTKPTEEQLELGRGSCQFRNQCQRGCSFGAYFSAVSATLPAARNTGNMTLVTDTLVERVLYDPETKRATGVRTINRKTGEKKDFTAKVVFLCASTIATNQILLNSTSETFQNGFANTSGVLGKYFMDHHHQVGARGQYPGFMDKYYYGRRPTGFYMPRFRNVDNQDGDFLRGYGFQGEAARPSWPRAIEQKGYGKDFKHSLREPGGWYMYFGGFGEMLPRAENTVTLHPTKTDKYGIPQVHLNISWSDNERKMREDIQKTAIEMLEQVGCTNIEPYNREATPGLAIHEMGGVRMGRDPKTSILNAYNQCHDVDNVFVTDGSAFASTACQNPSLTFMALTVRAVDYAATMMQQGKL